VRIIQKPRTVVTVLDHTCGNNGQLACVGGPRELAIPEFGLRNVDARFDHAVLIEEHVLDAVPLDELLHLGERLVPVEI
jgi:hypothetical protein